MTMVSLITHEHCNTLLLGASIPVHRIAAIISAKTLKWNFKERENMKSLNFFSSSSLSFLSWVLAYLGLVKSCSVLQRQKLSSSILVWDYDFLSSYKYSRKTNKNFTKKKKVVCFLFFQRMRPLSEQLCCCGLEMKSLFRQCNYLHKYFILHPGVLLILEVGFGFFSTVHIDNSLCSPCAILELSR